MKLLLALWSFLAIVVVKGNVIVTSIRREVSLPFTSRTKHRVIDPLGKHLCRNREFVQIPTNQRFQQFRIRGLSSSEAIQTRGVFPSTFQRLNVPHFCENQSFLGPDSKGRKLEIGPVTGSLESAVPEGLICRGIKLPEDRQANSEDIEIYTTGVYFDVLHPLPEELKQHEIQKMHYRDTLVTLVPYPAEVQYTTLILPSEEILSKTMAEPQKQENRMLSYGPFPNVEPYSLQPLSVHFVHDTPFITIQKAVKEVQVSLWGNIYVNEYYEIENTGAKLKGSWSRLDYQKQKAASSAVIEEFKAELPRNSDLFYYTDDIGNISTSKIINVNHGRIVALKPRYPLFGGWKTKFRFGYSTDLAGFLWHRPGHGNELHLQFCPSIHYPLIKDYELRIVLPDGSTDINFDQLPFPVDVSYDTKYWYFDVSGRPVLVLKKQNVVDQHQTTFKVKYNPSILAPYRKPILFFLIYFGLFSAYMIYLRLDFEIVGNNEENKERIRVVVSQLKTLFKERQERFEDFMSIISEMKNGQLSKKSTSLKNKIQSELKETHKKVLELRVSLRRLDYNRIYEVDDLISKDKDVEDHCLSFYDKKARLLEDKTSFKQYKDQILAMEKTASHLSAGMLDAFENLFRSE